MLLVKSFRYARGYHNLLKLINRSLNSSQTATALRPFYFAVHPDLFGKYPRERSVNEESLKVLHEYVSSLKSDRAHSAQPIELIFYIRSPENQKYLKDVKIHLKSTDIRNTVTTILQACGLPLDYLNTVPVKEMSRVHDWYATYPDAKIYTEIKTKPSKITLMKWLTNNVDRVKRYNEASQLAQTEIDKLCQYILTHVGVQSVRWENIWGNRHYIACLRTFNKICDDHLSSMRHTLIGRTLVFGNETGVNLHGEVVLGSEDVTTEWMSLLRTVHAYDPMIERLPKMELELSALLNNIKIMRRQKREFVMAQDYEVLLNKMLNSLRRCQDEVQRVLGNQDLSHLVLVVESDSGPLALSNYGLLLIPASIPGIHMLQFISENKERAATFLIDSKFHTFYLKQVLEQCHDKLTASQITQDDAITPKQMTECCQRLLDMQHVINPMLEGTKLKISTYYTLTRDGEITIPWNWVNEG